MAFKDHLPVIFFCIGGLVYVLIGASVFHAIEYPLEQKKAEVAVSTLTDFLASHTCVNASELASFLQDIKYLTDTGVHIGNSTEPSMWTFQSSVLFTATVLTTIGYGSQAPTTGLSQIFCVWYGLIGIPLCLVFLSKIGDGIAKINNGLVGKLVKWPKEDRKRTILNMGLLFIIGAILFVLIPCIGFAYKEGWSYATSWYFIMVTLSTVGFGDYVLARSVTTGVASGFYRVGTTLWVIVGLAWFSSIISTIQEWMTKDINKVLAINEPKTEEKPAQGAEREADISNTSRMSND